MRASRATRSSTCGSSRRTATRQPAARTSLLLLPTRPTPSSAFSPLPSAALLQALHHVRVLTPQRAIGLLRAGCSPHAHAVRAGPVAAWTEVRDWPEGAASPDAMFQSPAELAREHEHDPRVPAAKIILRAAEPWSPDTHQLWGARLAETRRDSPVAPSDTHQPFEAARARACDL